MPELPEPLGPVPTALIGHFRSGLLNTWMRVAEQTGTGLPFINALRKMYPKDPRQTQQEYYGLLSYINQTAKSGFQMGKYINALSIDSIIDANIFPKNFFLPTPDTLDDRFIVKFDYLYGVEGMLGFKQQLGRFFAGSLSTIRDFFERIKNKIYELFDIMQGNKEEQYKPYLKDDSLTVSYAFRRY